MNLPPNHRRSLSVTANVVEESLEEIERILATPGVQGASYRITPSYTDIERKHMLGLIQKIKAANAEMVAALGLDPRAVLESQILRGKLTHLWTVLVDSRSDGMKRFGKLPAQAAKAVDYYVENLLTDLKALEEFQER